MAPPTANAPGRVLIVGASDDARVLAAARALPAGGLLICLEADRAAAARAAQTFEREGLSRAANVMIGEPALFARKVRGPFDLILTTGGYGDRLGAELDAKLAPDGRRQDL